LAGVFAGYGSPVHKEDVGGSPPSQAVVPLRQPRLMIEGGTTDSSVHEVESPGQSSSSFSPFQPFN
jgi:hypothetical protein